MGMALLRLRKGGKGRKAGPGHEPAEPSLLMAHAPAHHPARPKAHTAAAPVVHIHIGPAAGHADEETPEEEAGESPAIEGAEDMPPPAILQALHDRIQKARAAGKR